MPNIVRPGWLSFNLVLVGLIVDCCFHTDFSVSSYPFSFIKTPNSHNNDLTNGEYYYTAEGKPLNMKEGNPALVGR